MTISHEERAELRQMIEDLLQPLIQRVNDHHDTLYGDGGLRDSVAELKSGQKRAEKSAGIRLALWLLAASAGLGGIVNLLLDLLT